MINIKKLCTIATVVCCSVSIAWSARALVIEQRDGSTTTFVLSEKPELSFSNHILQVSVSRSNTDFEISNVDQFYFSEVASDIEVVKKNELRITYQSNDKVIIDGTMPDDQVRLYSVGGVLYTDCINVYDGRVEVSLLSLPKGTYLIKVSNKQTFKVLKK